MRRVVIRAKNRAERHAAVDQAQRRQVTALVGEIAPHQQARVRGHAGFGVGLQIPEVAVLRIGTVFYTGNVGDAGVAQRQQMPGGQVAAEFLVHMERAQLGPLQGPLGDDHRLLARELLHIGIADVAGEDDEAIHPPRGQQLEAGQVRFSAPVAADDDGRMAAGLQPHLNAFERAGVKLALNRLRKHPHRHGDASLQAAGEDIGPELELRNGRLHRLALGRRHAGGAVQDARHRAGRHPGDPGHVQQGNGLCSRGRRVKGGGHGGRVYAMPRQPHLALFSWQTLQCR